MNNIPTKTEVLSLIPFVSGIPVTLPAASSDILLIEMVATWLNYDVANGDATTDTIKSYLSHFNGWVGWALSKGINPITATEEDIKVYRSFLQDECNSEAPTVKAKLSIMRRFYATMLKRGHISSNPVIDVKAAKDRRIQVNIKHLELGEAENILKETVGTTLRTLRDNAMINLMMLEGLRRVEIVRMSDIDLSDMEKEKGQILVHGKGKDRLIAPRQETIDTLKEYINVRGPIVPDEDGMPLFVSIDKGMTPRRRLSRIGVNKIIDSYLKRIGAKRKGLSCHALRHTCGYMLQKEFKDPKVVQEVLGHADLSTASKYAHIDGAEIARYTSKLRVGVNKQ